MCSRFTTSQFPSADISLTTNLECFMWNSTMQDARNPKWPKYIFFSFSFFLSFFFLAVDREKKMSHCSTYFKQKGNPQCKRGRKKNVDTLTAGKKQTVASGVTSMYCHCGKIHYSIKPKRKTTKNFFNPTIPDPKNRQKILNF